METNIENNGRAYSIFLMIELARISGIIKKDMEYDLVWDKGMRLYKRFELSEFNDGCKPEYECILAFLEP